MAEASRPLRQCASLDFGAAWIRAPGPDFSLFLAINRERTGKILFFGSILGLLLDFFGKFCALIQSLEPRFPCYSITGKRQTRNRESRARTGKEQGKPKHRGFDRHVKERSGDFTPRLVRTLQRIGSRLNQRQVRAVPGLAALSPPSPGAAASPPAASAPPRSDRKPAPPMSHI